MDKNKNEADLKSIFVTCCLISAFALAVLLPAPLIQTVYMTLEPTPHGTMVPDDMSAPAGTVTASSGEENPLYDNSQLVTHNPAKGTLSPVSVTTSPRINHGDPLANCPVDTDGNLILSEPSSQLFIGDEPAQVYNCADLATLGYQRGMAECIAASQDMNHPDYGQECA